VNGNGDYTDHFNCVVSDGSGSWFLGGFTMNPGTNSDFLVCKYDGDGNLIWRHVYNASGMGPDEVRKIAIDPLGNVVAAGIANNLGMGDDFWTMKFSASGDSLWSAFYNDANYNQYEELFGLSIDENGNVLVVGDSDSDPTSGLDKDFVAVKYSAEGVELWVEKQDFAGGLDRAEGVVASQNLIVITGRTNNGGDDDFTTIALNGSGTQLWLSTIDNGGTDRGAAIAWDGAGGVLVTGRSDIGGNDDFLTMKYAANGAISWTKYFDFVEDDRAELIQVSSNGNIYVAGRSDGNATAIINWNYRLVAYNQTGVQLWTATYDGVAANDDFPTGLATSNSGDVWITGFTDETSGAVISENIYTVKYNASGVLQWSSVFDPSPNQNDLANAIGLDSAGNALVVGSTEDALEQSDAVLLYYNNANAGTFTQITWAGEGDNTENVREFDFDSSGNIYLVGYSVNKNNDRDFSLIKMNNVGDTLWTRYITGTLQGSDEESNRLDVGTSAVIVSGYLKNSGTGSDAFIASYDFNGNLNWSSQYNSPVSESERSADMLVDALGNVYITGRTDVDPISTSNNEILVQKYSSAGALLWSNVITGNSADERGKFIRSMGSNIVVIGTKHNGSNMDVWIRAFSSAGATVWTSVYDSGSDDDVLDVSIDASNNLLIAGARFVEGVLYSEDAFVVKYDVSGNIVWQNSFSGASNGTDLPVSIVSDNVGGTFYTGITDTDASIAETFDVFLQHISATGEVEWTQVYNSTASQNDISDDLVVGTDGSLFLALHSDVDASQDVDYDWGIQHWSQTGSFLSDHWMALADSTDAPNVMKWNSGSLFVAGSTWNQLEQRNIVLVKYAFLPENIEEEKQKTWTVYPVPAFEWICVETKGTSFSGSYFKITDALGREVSNGQIIGSRLVLDINHFNKGIYFMQVFTGEDSFTKPFIKE
jgi:uncharacterized delta-60 repeat protein